MLRRSSRSRQRPHHPGSSRSTVLPVPEVQAKGHQRTRTAHGSEIAEDYVEVIADLIDADGEARAVDIARRLGVTHVTVTKTIARLREQGLVNSQPYRSIFLTDRGRQLAQTVRRRHEIVVRFLRSIGVSEQNAQSDAEGIEHHVSEETLAAMERCRAVAADRRKRGPSRSG